MLSAFTLAIGQLGDRKILAVLGKSAGITLGIFVVVGWLVWLGLNWVIVGVDSSTPLKLLIAIVLAVISGWLLFRLIALAVLQLFADEVVAAVEARHYPPAATAARKLGWRTELRHSWRGFLRAIWYNLAVTPLALLVIVTGFGPALVFAAVNAVLLGRELTEMVALRHRGKAGEVSLPGFAVRTALGAIVVALLLVPFVNLLAPVLGAAAATHLVHRRRAA